VPNAWFARDEAKSLMFFAGIHVPQWKGVRRSGTGSRPMISMVF
jgi:putative SOS response-associated peptidase YedK